MRVTLNLTTAVAIGTIIGWAQRNARVTFAVDGDTSCIVEGVARSIGGPGGSFATADDDVRDLFFRVSSTFEHFLPVSDVVEMLRDGLIAEV